MLTVKHIEKSGHQGIRSCRDVVFDPAIGQNKEYPNGQVVAFGVPADEGVVGPDGVCRFGSGHVYVMNEHGATVAKYILD